MKLRDYLARQGETQRSFSERTGIPQQTLADICRGGGTRTETAIKIRNATGGLVTVDDLIPHPPVAAEG